MSGMKNGHLPELLSVFENKEKFLLVYSTSHIGDILESNSDDVKQQEIIQSDFDFITRLTNDLCLFNTGQNVALDYKNPRELFDDQINSKKLTSDFSIDSLFESIKTEETLNPLLNSLKTLLKTINLDAVFKQAYETPEGAEMMNKAFPGLENDFTMNGFFKTFGLLYENLNEKEGLKDLRGIIQKIGINSSHFNPEKEPFKLIESAYSKFGIDDSQINSYFEKGKNAPIWFDEITTEYIKLDLHGFNSDKVKVTEKEKNTFRNTTEDAFHSAFASLCDFYITQDIKNFNKTRAVYNKLNIYTHVLKPNEFIEYYNNYLKAGDFDSHFNDVLEAVCNTESFHASPYDDDDGYLFTRFTNQFFFNFFNKILIPQTVSDPENQAKFILSKETPSKHFLISFLELEALIKILTEKFGKDDDGKDYLKTDEFDTENWDGRCWSRELITIKLVKLNGWFQFYFYANNDDVTILKTHKEIISKIKHIIFSFKKLLIKFYKSKK